MSLALSHSFNTSWDVAVDTAVCHQILLSGNTELAPQLQGVLPAHSPPLPAPVGVLAAEERGLAQSHATYLGQPYPVADRAKVQ